MKKTLVLLICTAIFCKTFAQTADNPGTWFNTFQKFNYDTPDVDSALFYLKKIASDKGALMMAKLAIHDGLALRFKNRDTLREDPTDAHDEAASMAFGEQLMLKALHDTSAPLIQMLRPLYLTTEVQKNLGNTAAVKKLVQEFIDGELTNENFFANAAGRYGLRICQLIAGDENLAGLRKQLFYGIKDKLREGQVTVTDSTVRSDIERRTWYRWLYAYANYIEAMGPADKQQTERLLKTAYEYSPDAYDKTYKADYYYDMVFLMGDEHDSFRDFYLDFLLKKGISKDKLLAMWLDMALNYPDYKDKLHHYYDSLKVRPENFDVYWANAIDAKAKPAVQINLPGAAVAPFYSKAHAGKWVLVDFWGTWCPVCREEHPAMQKFYDSVVVKNNGNIAFVAIACKDTEDKVLAYMKTKKFSFPVAMSDGVVEKKYLVQGYPTKILITPQGKYITIPFGVDWESYIKQYCSL